MSLDPLVLELYDLSLQVVVNNELIGLRRTEVTVIDSYTKESKNKNADNDICFILNSPSVKTGQIYLYGAINRILCSTADQDTEHGNTWLYAIDERTLLFIGYDFAQEKWIDYKTSIKPLEAYHDKLMAHYNFGRSKGKTLHTDLKRKSQTETETR